MIRAILIALLGLALVESAFAVPTYSGPITVTNTSNATVNYVCDYFIPPDYWANNNSSGSVAPGGSKVFNPINASYFPARLHATSGGVTVNPFAIGTVTSSTLGTFYNDGTGGFTTTPPAPPEFVRSKIDYSFQFDETFAGDTWSLRDQAGNILASGTVAGNGTFSGNYEDLTGSITGATLFVNGISTGMSAGVVPRTSSTDPLVPQSISGSFAAKPPFDVSYDQTYDGASWEVIEQGTGFVLLNGTFAPGGNVTSDFLDLYQSHSASLVVDGLPTGISGSAPDGISGILAVRSSNDTPPPIAIPPTPSNPVSPPIASSGSYGTAGPTTSSQASTPSAPLASTNAQEVREGVAEALNDAGGTVSAGDLSLDQSSTEADEAVMEQGQGIIDKIETIFSQFGQMHGKFAEIITSLANFNLGGVGGGGAIQMGPATIDVRNWEGANTVRNLLKLLVLILGFSSVVALFNQALVK